MEISRTWLGLFTIHQVYSNGVVELLNPNGIGSFKVNGQHLKSFMEQFSRYKEEITLLEPHQAWKENGLDGLSMSKDY